MATIHELHKKLVNKEISAVELTNAVIAHKAKVEPTVHAYMRTYPILMIMLWLQLSL